MADLPNEMENQPLNNEQNNKDAKTNSEKDSSVDCNLSNITINVYFDGTGNNMFNTEKRLEAYKSAADKAKEAGFSDIEQDIAGKKAAEEKKISFLSYDNDFSNVALLYRASERIPSATYNIYIEGAGTFKHQDDKVGGLGAATGASGIMDRVKEAFEKSSVILEKIQCAFVTFNVFGFSRGSFYGRYFVALLKESPETADLGPSKLESIYGNTIGRIPLLFNNNLGFDLPIRSDDYDFKHNGRALLLLQPEELSINVVGIYDTVASHGWSHHNDSIPFKLDIGAKQKINKLIHLTAQNDYRNHFALIKTNTAQSEKQESKEEYIGFECSFPGAHADIGGGYIKNIKEGTDEEYKGLYLSLYDDPFDVANWKRDMGEIYWKWYVKKGYFSANEGRYPIIRGKLKKLQNIDGNLDAKKEYDDTINAPDEYNIPRVAGMYGELEVVNGWTSYHVRAYRTVPGNAYQYIPLDVMRQLIEKKLNAVRFTDEGLPDIEKNISEYQSDVVLKKFGDHAINQATSNYDKKSEITLNPDNILSEGERKYLYHEYIHATLTAELSFNPYNYFASTVTNGSQDYNKDANYNPIRVVVLDNKSGVINEKPDREKGCTNL